MKNDCTHQILTATLIHVSTNVWENVLIEVGSEGVKPPASPSDVFSMFIKARLHVRFLMRFRVQISLIIAWIRNEVITYYLKTPIFPISANLAAFCRSVTRLKTCLGYIRLGGRFCTQNRIEIA